MTFASFYELFNSLTTVGKSRFVDWFDGNALNPIWTKRNLAGTGTATMNDAIDGGLIIQVTSGSNDQTTIGFNNKRNFYHNSSVIIFIAKLPDDKTNIYASVNGLNSDDRSDAGGTDFAGVEMDKFVTNWGLWTKDGTTSSTTESDVATDTSYHNYKIECGSTNIKLYIDGILKVIKTTNRPTIGMQPIFGLQNDALGNTPRVQVLYCEAYNY